jgi:hypothetical protein
VNHRFAVGQAAPERPVPVPGLPAPIVNVGIIGLGLGLGTLGYYNRKTDLGVLAMGAGSSIMGAGLVLLILDLAGLRQAQI